MQLNEIETPKYNQIILAESNNKLMSTDKFLNINQTDVAKLVDKIVTAKDKYTVDDDINNEIKSLQQDLSNYKMSDIDIQSKEVVQSVFMQAKKFNDDLPFFKRVFSRGKAMLEKLIAEQKNFDTLIKDVEKKLVATQKDIIITLNKTEDEDRHIGDVYKKACIYYIAYDELVNIKQNELNAFISQYQNEKDLFISSEIQKKQYEIELFKDRVHYWAESKNKILDRKFDLLADIRVKTNILNFIRDFLHHGIYDFMKLIQTLIKIEQNRKNLEYNKELSENYKELYSFAKDKGLQNLLASEEAKTDLSLGYDLMKEYHDKLKTTMDQIYDIQAEKTRIRDEEVKKYNELADEKLELLKPKIIAIDGLNI